ncbi:MAG: hypothetical protein NTU94_13045 [Planctomycetota bacterium]|nr:hypothetical protein [Planctomycetota bacterium]
MLRETRAAWEGGLRGEINWYDLLRANAVKVAEPRGFYRSVKANEVKGRAEAAGIKPRTLDRAKSRLKIEAGPDGFHGPWSWRLQGQSAPDSTECAHP